MIDAIHHSNISCTSDVCQRPYCAEHTRSHQNSEVKQRKARSVLGWGTAWEVLRVLLAFCCRLSAAGWGCQVAQPAFVPLTQTRRHIGNAKHRLFCASLHRDPAHLTRRGEIERSPVPSGEVPQRMKSILSLPPFGVGLVFLLSLLKAANEDWPENS